MGGCSSTQQKSRAYPPGSSSSSRVSVEPASAASSPQARPPAGPQPLEVSTLEAPSKALAVDAPEVVTASSIAIQAAVEEASIITKDPMESPYEMLARDDDEALGVWLEGVVRDKEAEGVYKEAAVAALCIATAPHGMTFENVVLVASRVGATRCVKLLLSAGGDHAIVGANGLTALHLAAGEAYPSAVAALLEFGADVNAVTKGIMGVRIAAGQSSLHRAANAAALKKPGAALALRILLKAGADAELRDAIGDTAYDCFCLAHSGLREAGELLSGEARYQEWLRCFEDDDCASTVSSVSYASSPVLKRQRRSFADAVTHLGSRSSALQAACTSAAQQPILTAQEWGRLHSDMRGLLSKARFTTGAGGHKPQLAPLCISPARAVSQSYPPTATAAAAPPTTRAGGGGGRKHRPGLAVVTSPYIAPAAPGDASSASSSPALFSAPPLMPALRDTSLRSERNYGDISSRPDPFPSTLTMWCKLVVWDFDKTVLRIHSFGDRIRADAVPARDMNRDFCDLKFFRSLVRALSSAGIQVAIASFGVYGVIQAYMDTAFDGEVDSRGSASTPVLPPPTMRGQCGPRPDVLLVRSCSSSPPPVPLSMSPAVPCTTAAAGSDDTIVSAPSGGAMDRYFHRENIVTPSVVGGVDGCSLRSGKGPQLKHLCSLYHVDPDEVLFFDDDPLNIDGAVEEGFTHSVLAAEGFDRKLWLSAVRDIDVEAQRDSMSS